MQENSWVGILLGVVVSLLVHGGKMAARPAINAGTLGADWCDYILADTTAIPPSTLRPWRSNLSLTDVFRDEEDSDKEDWMYSENIIFCRDTFFCCDHAQSASKDERSITWEEQQQRRWRMRKEPI